MTCKHKQNSTQLSCLASPPLHLLLLQQPSSSSSLHSTAKGASSPRLHVSVRIMSVQELSDSQETNRERREQEKVTITVKGQDQRDQSFTLRRNDKLGKVFNKYCQKKDLNLRMVRFVYKGKRVEKNQTPNQLKMKNRVQISALMEQMGGGGRGRA